MQQHVEQILALLREIVGEQETLDDYHVSVESILAIGPEWVLSHDDRGDPHWGCIDAKEFDEFLDRHFIDNGPCAVEHNGALYVLGGNWKYPIYFRFEKAA